VHTVTSDAMDIPEGLFNESPRDIAEGLKEAVMDSNRTRGTKYQSAMSMLNFYINRAGRNLSAHDHARLEEAKDELSKVFDSESSDEN
jgi:triphosphoribosyl-dephospho-CoA synthetase